MQVLVRPCTSRILKSRIQPLIGRRASPPFPRGPAGEVLFVGQGNTEGSLGWMDDRQVCECACSP